MNIFNWVILQLLPYPSGPHFGHFSFVWNWKPNCFIQPCVPWVPLGHPKNPWFKVVSSSIKWTWPWWPNYWSSSILTIWMWPWSLRSSRKDRRNMKGTVEPKRVLKRGDLFMLWLFLLSFSLSLCTSICFQCMFELSFLLSLFFCLGCSLSSCDEQGRGSLESWR